MVRPTLIAAGLGALFLVGACGATKPVQHPTAMERAQSYARTVEARIAGAQDAPSYRVRFNPTALCPGCPHFEIELDGVWHRLELTGADPDDEVILAIREAVERARVAKTLDVWDLQATLDDTLKTCGRGAIVVTAVPTRFGAPEPEPPEPPEPTDDAPSE